MWAPASASTRTQAGWFSWASCTTCSSVSTSGCDWPAGRPSVPRRRHTARGSRGCRSGRSARPRQPCVADLARRPPGRDTAARPVSRPAPIPVATLMYASSSPPAPAPQPSLRERAEVRVVLDEDGHLEPLRHLGTHLHARPAGEDVRRGDEAVRLRDRPGQAHLATPITAFSLDPCLLEHLAARGTPRDLPRSPARLRARARQRRPMLVPSPYGPGRRPPPRGGARRRRCSRRRRRSGRAARWSPAGRRSAPRRTAVGRDALGHESPARAARPAASRSLCGRGPSPRASALRVRASVRTGVSR